MALAVSKAIGEIRSKKVLEQARNAGHLGRADEGPIGIHTLYEDLE